MPALDYETPADPGRQRSPLAELLILALPTVAQMASYTLMQFADRWMLAYVGDLEATAAGTAGITFFCFLGFGFGMLLVVNTLASQAFGREDYAAAGRYLWQGAWVGIAFGLLVMLTYPLADPLFRSMGHAAEVAVLEADYYGVVILAAPLKLLSIAAAQFLLGIQRPTIVFVGTLAGVFVNLFFNWLLIYGNWGFPALGVAGAAWGTNGAVVVELLVMAAYLYRPTIRRMFNTADARPRPEMLRTLLKIGTPAGFQLVCDITAWMVFMNVIVGGFGTAALAANSFAFSYMHLCFMPAIGVGSAVTALVGKYIGAGRPEISAQRAHLGFFVCAAYMMAAGVTLAIFRHQLIGVFSDDPEVIRIGATLMLFVAAYQLFDAMFVVYVGALRGAGDTLVPAVVQAVLVWAIVVGGGAFMTRYAPEYGVAGPWMLATLFGAILGLFLQTRFRAGGWKSIRLEGSNDSDTVARGFSVETAS